VITIIRTFEYNKAETLKNKKILKLIITKYLSEISGINFRNGVTKMMFKLNIKGNFLHSKK